MTGSKGERNILEVFEIHFFCICFVKTNKQKKRENRPIKKRLLVTIIVEVLIAEQGNAVPMAD